MALAAVNLHDKYTLESGRIYLTGTQALVRLPLMQYARDKAAGITTGCFISGYRGSPLGGLDQALWSAKKYLEKAHVHFQPGVNEDLGFTAIWGSQQTPLFPGAKVDGVFALGYAKGPGIDRSGDVLRHGNLAGSARHGGVVILAGDDHTCKSSTTAHQTEFAFVDAMIPVINPAGVQEFLDLGLHGWAMSRYSGCWTAFKTVAETVDTSASVFVDPHRLTIQLPQDFALPVGGLNIRWPDDPLSQERRLHEWKLEAVKAYTRANRLDRIIMGGPQRRLGIITCGKSYLDVRQALDDLGIDERLAAELGLSVYKLAVTWPIEPQGLRAFAEGLDQILVVEEKRGLVEGQLKDLMYHWPADKRPQVTGKQDETGAPLLPSFDELTPAMIARAIAGRLPTAQAIPTVQKRLADISAKEQELDHLSGPTVKRIPYFCSGCPHNTSTQVPEGSRALAGIGCHYMVQWMDRDTDTFTQMGGEGVTWVGQAPFMTENHVFTNLGDGTYYHSGLLALRQAVAAKVNITYKILYNDAVAMTGGQHVDGPLTPSLISLQVYAEGVRRIALVSDDPTKYPLGTEWAPGTSLHHRRELDTVQRELREWPGVSVLIYDQTCAAEKRRRRKRGLYPDPPMRAFINARVCEGCGDCSKTSNCLSVVPLETEFGRKRAIDQSSCNKDFSCVEGFCPSFVTVHGGDLRKGKAAQFKETTWPILPEATPPTLSAQPYGILVTGIGGTGVVTIGALLGMAAHLEGKGCSVLDMAGLAQKGGAVTSHIRIGRLPDDIHAVRIAAGGADLLLACDMVVASGPDVLAKLQKGRSRAVVNSTVTPTADFTLHRDFQFPEETMRQRIIADAYTDFVAASTLATQLLGDSLATNMFILGYAWQKGLIPLSREAIERAIEINGAAVDMNQRAFLWGRRAAVDLAKVQAITNPTPNPPATSETFEDSVTRRISDLTAYQNLNYARRYKDLVVATQTAENHKASGKTGLAVAIAKNYYKLLAYKDEYEVARLYTDGTFHQRLRETFSGDYKLHFHLAAPLLAPQDQKTGHLKKVSYGPWVYIAFKILARLKGLRGTWLDPFGKTAERKLERQLIKDYEILVGELLANLTPVNHGIAVALASLPSEIRGYGHIKEASIFQAKEREAELLQVFRAPPVITAAAE